MSDALTRAPTLKWQARAVGKGYGLARPIPGQPGLWEYRINAAGTRRLQYRSSGAAQTHADVLNASPPPTP